MAEKVLALYFEDTGIKLLAARGRKVEAWETVTLEPGLITGGLINNENRVAEKVKEIFININRSKGGGGLSGKGKIIVGLSGHDSLYRVISLPNLDKNMMAEAIRREAGRVLPVSLDQLYLAYQRIPGADNESKVFVAAFPKKSADVLLRTLKLAGVTPHMLDLAPLALCIAVNEPRAIIADARLDSLSIMVLADRVPQVIRSLSLQSEGKSVTENMATISEEFSRTIAFYNSSHQQAQLSSEVPVFVSGELANTPSTWPALIGNLNFKVGILPSVMQFPPEFPANDFIINMGLAAKELGLEKEHANYSLVNLNALPASALPTPFNVYRVVVPVVAVAGIAFVLIQWNNLQNTKKTTTSIQTQITAEQNLINANKQAIAAETTQNEAIQVQIQPIQDNANIFTNKIKSVTAARTLTDSDVHILIALKPATVFISALSYNSVTQGLSGSCGNSKDILSYAQALRDKGLFKTVVSSITYAPIILDDGTKVDNFTYTLSLN
jgi:hypothetical protein